MRARAVLILIGAGAAALSGASVPGTSGTPARSATPRAPVLLPISRIASGEGPMNVSPEGKVHIPEKGDVYGSIEATTAPYSLAYAG